MRTPKRIGRIVPLLFLAASLLYAQSNGKEVGSEDFLLLQTDTQSFRELFQDYISREHNIAEVVTLLDEVLPRMDTNPAKQFLLGEAAILHDLLGRLEKAQSLYEKAALYFPDRILYEKLLRSAEILYETGRYDRASSQARAVLSGASKEDIRLSAETLILEIETVTSAEGVAGEEPLGIIRSLLRKAPEVGSSSILYRWYRAAAALGLEEEADLLAGLVKEKFPKSPEASLLAGSGPYADKVKPSDYLLPELLEPGRKKKAVQVETASIQTGLFRKRSNAADMRDRLEGLGFAAEIREKSMGGELFYTVLVPDIPLSRSQETVLALKEEGFEGFLVFGE